VTSLTLVNADTDRDVGLLANGTTIDLSKVGSRLNVRANPGSGVGSVRFVLDGGTPREYSKVETHAPLAAFGDNAGDYAAWTPTVGSHTFTVTPFSGTGATGTAGQPLTVNFNVVSGTPAPTPTGAAINGFTLFNAATDARIGTMSNGMTLNLNTLGRSLNVRADTSSGAVGSVAFFLDGVRVKTENTAPYTIGGDVFRSNGTIDYLPWTPKAGSHTLKAVVYSGASGGGTAGQSRTITFNVVG